MTTFVSTLSRDVACGAGAVLITLVLGFAFVASTAVPPGARAQDSFLTLESQPHAWLGLPQPAVLVD